MKIFVVALIAVGMSAAPAKKTVKKAAPVAQPAETQIPSGATPTDDGSFRYTDAAGKKWLYRNTPFGVSKVEDKPAVPVTQRVDETIKATEDGDTVRFEKTSPFGVTKWQKKRAALTAEEQAVLDRQKNTRVAGK